MLHSAIYSVFHAANKSRHAWLSRLLALSCLLYLIAACAADTPAPLNEGRSEGTLRIVGQENAAPENVGVATQTSAGQSGTQQNNAQQNNAEQNNAEPDALPQTEASAPAEAEQPALSEPAAPAPAPDAAVEPDPNSAENPQPTPTAALVLFPTPTPSPVPRDMSASASEQAPPATLPPFLIPTDTPAAQPQIVARSGLNVRSGPGTEYPVVAGMAAGDRAEIVGRNPAADWWQVLLSNGVEGWVYAQLVDSQGRVEDIAIAADIPTPPPPTPTAPIPTAQPAAPAVEPAVEPTSAVGTQQTEPAAANEGPAFRVVEKRLWDVVENGGWLDGPSVTCGLKRELVVNVLDANGNRLNGIAVQAQYGAKEIFVTGAQGKGDGVVEFVLGKGQDVKVIRDADGREAVSEMAAGLSTEPAAIPYEHLIAGRYCSDDESCRLFVEAGSCWAHFSWTVTFQRNY
jgi:hypothetical protein